MTVKVNIKQLGKKRDRISGAPFVLEHVPETAEQLIREAVHTCVSQYNARVEAGESGVKPLSEGDISEMSEIGKIAFGINYGNKTADETEAVAVALQAYEDGLFRVFVDEEELTELSQPLSLSEDSTLTFIRLTMLAGRMW